MDQIFDESFIIPSQGFNIRAYRTTVHNLEDTSISPIFIFHHGAGLSSYSWAPMIDLSKHSKLFPDGTEFLCFDAAGHGETKKNDILTSNDCDIWSMDFLVKCFVDVLKGFSERYSKSIESFLAKAIFVGHSLGGVIVTRSIPLLSKPPFALVLLDTVEETAIRAFSHLPFFLSTRPNSFVSIQDAMDWAFKSSFMRNVDSIRLTLPYLLKEEHMNDSDKVTFTWKTDLGASKHHWYSWFTHLDKLFISSPSYRLLILADTDRLDTTLTIGQMQGKFQLEIIRNSGHLVAEDAPDQVLQILSKFWNHKNQPIIKSKR